MINLEGGGWNQYPRSLGRGLVLVEYLGACAWRRPFLPTRQTLPPEWSWDGGRAEPMEKFAHRANPLTDIRIDDPDIHQLI
jgi:hypothetical protein